LINFVDATNDANHYTKLPPVSESAAYSVKLSTCTMHMNSKTGCIDMVVSQYHTQTRYVFHGAFLESQLSTKLPRHSCT